VIPTRIFADHVVIVLGANDDGQPRAKEASDRPLYGMPVLEVDQCRSVFWSQRSPLVSAMPAFATNLFELPQTSMVFGDCKQVLQGPDPEPCANSAWARCRWPPQGS